ncbi:PH domain-containing protein [Schleiferilactobacillus shenzhenensis]|nr:PH domain-containing protein [Schleiferilactobacillus shenzhenensis]
MDQLEKLPERIKTVWRADAVADAGWLLVPLAAAIYVVYWRHWPVWLLPLAGALLVIVPLVQLVLVPYRYTFTGYRIRPESVELRSGFIFRKQESIPTTRIQNVTIEQGPLLRWQKLQAVRVATASTSAKIDGVEPAEAERLRAAILKLALEVRDDR